MQLNLHNNYYRAGYERIICKDITEQVFGPLGDKIEVTISKRAFKGSKRVVRQGWGVWIKGEWHMTLPATEDYLPEACYVRIVTCD